MKILFLEDDPIISEIVIEYLEKNSYEVSYAFDINEAQSFIDESSYDIFLFDVNVPDGSSFEFLEYIRSIGDNTPTIFITALNSIEDMKVGFKSGCDDYIKKPFELDELELRLNNIKRIYKLDDIINIDTNISLDKSKYILTIDNEEKNIREKEIMVLEYLSKNCNKIVSQDELCQNIWAYDDKPSDATIRTYIKNLRLIVGSQRIETVKGVGYRFIKS